MYWWNSSYPLRRDVQVGAPQWALPAGTDVTLPLDITEFIAMGKVREDYADVEVVHVTTDATPVVTVLSRKVTETSVTFPLATDLSAMTVSNNYWIYYCNPRLNNQPTRPTYAANDWPIDVGSDSQHVSYTRPGEHWLNGVSSTAGAKATLKFPGTQFRLISETGNGGQAQIYIDDVKVTDVDLYSQTQQEATIYESPILEDGFHRAQIIVNGTARAPATSPSFNIVEFSVVASFSAIDLAEEFYSNEWVAYTGGD